jgi:hypothetical protein
VRIEDWFLTAEERGNPAYTCPTGPPATPSSPTCTARRTSPGWSTCWSALEPDDHLFFTDWRGDADERMRPEGPTVGTLFGDAAKRAWS